MFGSMKTFTAEVEKRKVLVKKTVADVIPQGSFVAGALGYRWKIRGFKSRPVQTRNDVLLQIPW